MIDASTYQDEAYESLEGSMIGEEANEGGWTLLPKGVYIYTITNIESERYEPGPTSKLPPCWKVTVGFNVRNAAGDTGHVNDNFYFTKKQSWKIKNLFVSAGLITRDTKEFAPDWKKLMGHDGVMKLKVRTYKDRDGNERETNDIDAYLDPEDGQKALLDTPTPAQASASAVSAAATTPTTPASAAVPTQTTPVAPTFSFPKAQ